MANDMFSPKAIGCRVYLVAEISQEETNWGPQHQRARHMCLLGHCIIDTCHQRSPKRLLNTATDRAGLFFYLAIGLHIYPILSYWKENPKQRIEIVNINCY